MLCAHVAIVYTGRSEERHVRPEATQQMQSAGQILPQILQGCRSIRTNEEANSQE